MFRSERLIALFATLLLAAGANAQLRWSRVLPPPPRLTPPARNSHAMAFDSVRGVVVMFGGNSDSDTWEWNGAAWARKAIPGPSGSYALAMAFDAARGVCVLFGGANETGLQGQTWEYDGTQWMQRNVPGPSPRAGHAMAYDARRGVCVLFGGGDDSGNLGDTWEFDGEDWTQRFAAGPSPRPSAGMAFDSARGVTVFFGGGDSSLSFGDTWEWDGTEWTQRAASGPAPRHGHLMAYDSLLRATVVFSGLTLGTLVADTWEWDGESWSQFASSGPTGRYASAMTFDSVRNESILFGGSSGSSGDLDDTWAWGAKMWGRRNLPTRWAPPEMSNHAMTYDSGRQVVVLFGSGQTWEWDGAAWHSRPAAGPSHRNAVAMAYDPRRGVTVLFGGEIGAYSFSAETWEWNGAVWTNRTTTNGPAARGYATMAFDTSRGVIAMFGGCGAVAPWTNNELWEWDGGTWTQRVIAGAPPARMEHSMAFDASRGALVVFGGRVAPMTMPVISDVWELRDDTWTQILPSTVGARIGTAMVYDTLRQVEFQFGGSDVFSDYDTSRDWDGLGWTTWPIDGPAPRHGHAMAYDEARGEAVLFGGCVYNDGCLDDTWILRWSCDPYINLHPTGGAACTGNPITLTIQATGGEDRSYQWRQDGSPLTDDPGHIAGALTPTLELQDLSLDDAGDYDCVVTNSCASVTSNSAAITVYEYPGDLDCDADVDVGDLATLLSNFGRTDAPSHAEGDLDRDGDIDLEDLQLLLSSFGVIY